MRNDITRIYVDKKLRDLLRDIQRDIALEIKKKYNLEKITIYGTVASNVLVSKFNSKKKIRFKIKKINSREGIIELI